VGETVVGAGDESVRPAHFEDATQAECVVDPAGRAGQDEHLSDSGYVSSVRDRMDRDGAWRGQVALAWTWTGWG